MLVIRSSLFAKWLKKWVRIRVRVRAGAREFTVINIFVFVGSLPLMNKTFQTGRTCALPFWKQVCIKLGTDLFLKCFWGHLWTRWDYLSAALFQSLDRMRNGQTWMPLILRIYWSHYGSTVSDLWVIHALLWESIKCWVVGVFHEVDLYTSCNASL